MRGPAAERVGTRTAGACQQRRDRGRACAASLRGAGPAAAESRPSASRRAARRCGAGSSRPGRSPSGRSLLRSASAAVTAQARDPVAQQRGRRRRRTSRGGTGSRTSGPFSTAATNRSPPCSAQVTSGGRGAAVGDQRPVAHGVGVHEVEPLVLDAGEQRASPSGDLDGVPAHVRHDRRLQPLDRPRATRRSPRCSTPCSTPRVEQHLHARRRCRAPAGRRRAAGR